MEDTAVKNPKKPNETTYIRVLTEVGLYHAV
jgi:hypothetical protein